MARGTDLHQFVVSGQTLKKDSGGEGGLGEIMQRFQQFKFPLNKADLNITPVERSNSKKQTFLSPQQGNTPSEYHQPSWWQVICSTFLPTWKVQELILIEIEPYSVSAFAFPN